MTQFLTIDIAFFGSPTAIRYNNVIESKTIIRANLIYQRGIYIWTNTINGDQYVGSSNNLGVRLSSYFSKANLASQAKHGNHISRAILKYNLNNFSLQVIPMGPTLPTPNAEADYLSLEQYYLDTYTFAYNSNRWVHTINSSKPNQSSISPTEPSIHKDNIDVASISRGRGKTILMYVYNASTLEIITSFFSAAALSVWIGASEPVGLAIYRKIMNTPQKAVYYGITLIISTQLIEVEMLSAIVDTLPYLIRRPIRLYKTNNKIVYGKNMSNGEIHI